MNGGTKMGCFTIKQLLLSLPKVFGWFVLLGGDAAESMKYCRIDSMGKGTTYNLLDFLFYCIVGWQEYIIREEFFGCFSIFFRIRCNCVWYGFIGLR